MLTYIPLVNYFLKIFLRSRVAEYGVIEFIKSFKSFALTLLLIIPLSIKP